jgi:hypothetical protein
VLLGDADRLVGQPGVVPRHRMKAVSLDRD